MASHPDQSLVKPFARVGIVVSLLLSVVACGGDLESSAPPALPSPSGQVFQVVIANAIGRPEAPQVEVVDFSGLVTDARPTAPDEFVADNTDDAVINPQGDRRRLGIVWGGPPCETRARMTLTGTADALAIRIIRDVRPPADCEMSMDARYVMLHLGTDVLANAVQLDIQPSAEQNP